MSEFCEYKLSELGKWLGGGTPSKSKKEYWFDGNIPWVSPKDMKRFRVDSSEDYITKLAIENTSAKLIPKGSVLIVTRSGILQRYVPIAINEVPVTINQDLKAIIPNGKVRSDYLANTLKLQNNRVLHECAKVGTTVESLGTDLLKGFKIVAPDIKEQGRIMAIIGTWGKAISKTEKLIKAKKRYKKGLMQRLLSGKVRFPEFEGEDWNEVKLGDITEVISSNLDKKIKEGQEDVRLCNYMDVYDNAIIDSSLPFMESTASEREIEKYTLKQDDVIITKDSETADDIANAAVVKKLESRVLCGYHLAILRPNKEKVLGDFLAKQIMTFVYRKQFFQMANGATRYGLRISDIENAKFNIPSLEEQKKISTLINSINNEINLLNKQKLAFENQKKGLMQQLLTGKVRVN